MKDQYWMAEDCPQCGEKDEEWKWKGARTGSTDWGHKYSCCSEKCGLAYRDNPKRHQRDVAILLRQRDALNRAIRESRRAEKRLRGVDGSAKREQK